MSNARFSILQAKAVKDKRISDAQFRTLAALGMYADENGWCFPRQATVGKDLNKSRQAINRDIKALKELGYLEVTEQFKDDGSQRANLYRLIYDFSVGGGETPALQGVKQADVTGGETSGGDSITTQENDQNNLPLDWKVANGMKITDQDLRLESHEGQRFEQEARDTAELIGQGQNADLIELAYAFMTTRGVLCPLNKKDLAAWRKPLRAMREARPKMVNGEHVREATLQLMSAVDKNGKAFTVTTPYHIQQVAIGLANPAQEPEEKIPEYYKPFVEEEKHYGPNPGPRPKISPPRPEGE